MCSLCFRDPLETQHRLLLPRLRSLTDAPSLIILMSRHITALLNKVAQKHELSHIFRQQLILLAVCTTEQAAPFPPSAICNNIPSVINWKRTF